VLPASTALLAVAVGIAAFAAVRRLGAGSGGGDGVPAARAGDGPDGEAAALLVREMNETTAVNVLSNLALRQFEIRLQARIDVDRDGRGEAGGFVELSGGLAGRRPTRFDPPVLAREYGALDANGELLRGGYRFRVFLPGRSGRGVGEGAAGFAAGDVDADGAERSWWAYAWPESRGTTGTRTFSVDAGGTVLATDGPYSGAGGGPPEDAAPRGGGPASEGAEPRRGGDGRLWRSVR
jgi:hypothetical protein